MFKHIEEMNIRDNVTLLKVRNRAGGKYDNEWISGV